MQAPTSVTISISNLSQKAAMPNIEANELQMTVEKKKHPQVINILKKSVGATTITKNILDLEINLIIDKLIASALLVEKQLRKTITEDNGV